jgi:hypothetical protein
MLINISRGEDFNQAKRFPKGWQAIKEKDKGFPKGWQSKKSKD